MRRRFLSPLFAALMILAIDASAQRLAGYAKVGTFIYVHSGEVTAFSLNVELERTFRANDQFTHGPRFDFIKSTPFGTAYRPGIENAILGYELKFYPRLFRMQKAYQGAFIGLEPCYFVKSTWYDKYGPGLGTLLGYQHVFKKGFSLSAENCMSWMVNVNQNPRYSATGLQFMVFVNIKAGFRL